MSKRRKPSPGKAAQGSEPLPWLLGGGAILIGIVVLVALASRPAQQDFSPSINGAPAVVVERDLVDHGIMKFNSPATSVFTIRNVGDQPLTILGEPRVELVEGC